MRKDRDWKTLRFGHEDRGRHLECRAADSPWGGERPGRVSPQSFPREASSAHNVTLTP